MYSKRGEAGPDEIVIRLRRSLLIAVIFALIVLLAIVSWFIFNKIPNNLPIENNSDIPLAKPGAISNQWVKDYVKSVNPDLIKTIYSKDISKCNDFTLEKDVLFCKFTISAMRNETSICMSEYDKTIVFKPFTTAPGKTMSMRAEDYCWVIMGSFVNKNLCSNILNKTINNFCNTNDLSKRAIIFNRGEI